MRALFRSKAKLAIGNDVDLGSTAGFGFELRHDCWCSNTSYLIDWRLLRHLSANVLSSICK